MKADDPAPLDDDGRIAVALRASRVAVGLLSTAGRYELERVLRPHARLEADTKKRLGRAILASIGMDVTVEGSMPTSHRPRLVVANHRSALDIAMMLAFVDDPVMLSRGDLANWPVLGRLAKQGHTLFVDRDDRANGAKAVRAMRRSLTRNRTLCVFPEGTTHAEPHVRPFIGGAFVAAHGMDVELVPVGIAYAKGLEFVQPSMGLHLRNVMRKSDLRAAFVVGAPRATHGRKTAELIREAHADVSALFERASSIVR